ncbi:N-acetylglutamate kinase [Lachnospiraceae bacterium NE2001]|nr:N-acetylglutamate kinase [Lachnospiraceae bacterium NE2001]
MVYREDIKMVKNDDIEEVKRKAQTLIEALPYIKKFSGKKIVVKYGGSAMLDENLKFNVIQDVALLKLVGLKPIIVHGGGKEISKWIEKLGMETRFQNGLRVTDEPTLEVAEMVLNNVNRSLVGLMSKVGLNAVGISGKDAGLLKVQKKLSDGKDIGYVGEVVETDSSVLDSLLEADFIPVVAPIGMGMDDDHDYNINADDCACAVATAINAEKLVFLTDIEGVFTDPTDKKTLISEMTLDEAQQLIDEGVVGGGMLPKLQNCIDAMKNGVSRVHILDGRLEHCLLLEFYTEKGIGTAILNDEAN